MLELAVAPNELTDKERKKAIVQARPYVQDLGFEYLSDVGVKPLGSMGGPTKMVAPKDAIVNAQPGQTAQVSFDKAGLTLESLPDGQWQAVVAIRNQGNAPSPKFPVLFYAGHPQKNGRLISTNSAGPIMPNEVWREGTRPFVLKETEKEIFVVIDPDNLLKRPAKSKSLILGKAIGGTEKKLPGAKKK